MDPPWTRLPAPQAVRRARNAGDVPETLVSFVSFVGLTSLDLYGNDLTAVPSELRALTFLRFLDLGNNQLTGVPAEFRTWGPSGDSCFLGLNPGFSCANVGTGTSCCTGDVLFGNQCGEGLSGGPCYAG